MPIPQNTLKDNSLAAGRKIYSTHCLYFKVVKHNISWVINSQIRIASVHFNEVAEALLWREYVSSGVGKPS